MTPLRQLPRMLRIAATLVRYRLDELVEGAHLFRPLKWLRPLLPRPHADIARLSRGARLRLALVELGPIFVKFGQILSTRRDLLPGDVADELSLLQDQVPPFPGSQARAAIEAALGAPIATLYKTFDETPLASASIAQVHAATLWLPSDSVVPAGSPPSGPPGHLPPQAEEGAAGRTAAADLPPSGPPGHLPPQAEEGTAGRTAAADLPPSGPPGHLPPQAEEGRTRRPAAAGTNGRQVVVKVLRPGIHERIADDVALLRALAELAQRWHPAADKIRPRDIVAEIESTLNHELDLQREGANASLLRRNFLTGEDLIVPQVYWSHTKDSVLTLERVRGIGVDDLQALDAAGIDRMALAEKGVRVFYTQVFRDNFFHADAHPGNIWVDATRKENPRFIALDFGIMGSLPERDQFLLAENFMALFDRDYKRIAELHVAAGWMPAHVRLDELEASVRTVCEPYFTRPLSQISLGEVVVKLFAVARRYELTLQPQLILLQKTLLNIEGIGRTLYPDIDIWAVARPVLSDILRRRYGIRRTLRELRARVPTWLAAAPEMPQLVHTYLKKAAAGDFDAARARDDEGKAAAGRTATQSLIFAVVGATALLCATIIYALDVRLAHLPRALPASVIAFVGVLAFVLAWRRSR